jgi:hypothetical protein
VSDNKLQLTEAQFLAVTNAARALGLSNQAVIFQAVADELNGKVIGDGSVGCAIRIAQAKFVHPTTAHAPHSSWRGKKAYHGRSQGRGKIDDAA